MIRLTLSKGKDHYDYNFANSKEALKFASNMVGFGYVIESLYLNKESNTNGT